MSNPTLITFIAYFIILLGIGFFFYRRSFSIEDYLLGGRGMGSWVTALSAQASDMSGWLLMGLPGWDRTGVDCRRSVYRYVPELDTRLGSTSGIYSKSQCNYAALLLRGPLQRPDRSVKNRFGDNHPDILRHICIFRACRDRIIVRVNVWC
jgi:hypothetical protein